MIGRLRLNPSVVGTLTDTCKARFAPALSKCSRDDRHVTESNWLLLKAGFELRGDNVHCIADTGDFATTIGNNADEYEGENGYMTIFYKYMERYHPSVYATLVECVVARQKFRARTGEYVNKNIDVDHKEFLHYRVGEKDVVIGPGVNVDGKHLADAATAAALAHRSSSDLVAARAAQKAKIAARYAAVQAEYARGASPSELTRIARGDDRVSVVPAPAPKVASDAQVEAITNSMAMVKFGTDMVKAAKASGSDDDAKAARKIQTAGVAAMRTAAAKWPGAMQHVDRANAVAQEVGDIFVLNNDGVEIPHPVYVVADANKFNWFVVKEASFMQMCGVGRKTPPHIDEVQRIKCGTASAIAERVVPLYVKTFRIAAGTGGSASYDLAASYEMQVLAIRDAYTRNAANATATLRERRRRD
jgi:hypothetical protein